MIKKIVKSLILKIMPKIYKGNNAVEGMPVQRILIVRLDEIGDMVLMSPFLRELRRNYPSAEITLVVKPAVYNLVELCPYVNYINVFHRPSQGLGMFCRALWAAKRFVKQELEGEYDLAIVPRFDSDAGYGAGFIAFFSGASRRVGYASDALPSKIASDYGYDALYTDVVPVRPEIVHEVERNLDVLKYIGCTIQNDALEIWTSQEDDNVAAQFI